MKGQAKTANRKTLSKLCVKCAGGLGADGSEFWQIKWMVIETIGVMEGEMSMGGKALESDEEVSREIRDSVMRPDKHIKRAYWRHQGTTLEAKPWRADECAALDA